MDIQFNPDFSFCVDVKEIRLVDRKKKTAFCLAYPQAAVFDLLLKGYAPHVLVRMMTKIAHIAPSHAESLIQDTISQLLEKKVIIKK